MILIKNQIIQIELGHKSLNNQQNRIQFSLIYYLIQLQVPKRLVVIEQRDNLINNSLMLLINKFLH